MLGRPDAHAVQRSAAADLGAEYMELVARTFRPGSAGDLQLAARALQQRELLERVALAGAPGPPHVATPACGCTWSGSRWSSTGRAIVDAERLRGTGHARRPRPDHRPHDRLRRTGPPTARARAFPGLSTTAHPPKVVVTFVIDGGGWNVLHHWPNDWPNLRRLMASGANYRNAIAGSFPAVTACAHATIGTGTFPRDHGITGHNIRTPEGVPEGLRQGRAGPARRHPAARRSPTCGTTPPGRGSASSATRSGTWACSARAARRAPSPTCRSASSGTRTAKADGRRITPTCYRLPAMTPGLDVYEARKAAFTNPGWDSRFAPQGRQTPCCEPPIVQYQGDLIEATFDSEPIGDGEATSLLYINFKSPDYTGHVYNMLSEWESLMLREAVTRSSAARATCSRRVSRASTR